MTIEETSVEKKFLKIETKDPDSILEIVYFLNKYSNLNLKEYKTLKIRQDTSTIAIYDLATDKLENLTKFLVNSKTLYEVLSSDSKKPYFGYLEIPLDSDEDIESFIKDTIVDNPDNKCDGRICESISDPVNKFTQIDVKLDLIRSKIEVKENENESLFDITLENLDKFELDTYCIPQRKEYIDEVVSRFIKVAYICDIEAYNKLIPIQNDQEKLEVFKDSFWKNLDKFLESKMESNIELKPMVGSFENLVEFWELIKIAIKAVEKKFISKFEIPISIDAVVKIKATSYEDAVEILKEFIANDIRVKTYNQKISIKDSNNDC